MGKRGSNRDQRSALDMLERCHRRLDETLYRLTEIAQGAASSPATIDAERLRSEVDEISAFLQRTGRRHEIDEEQSLFPRLRIEQPALSTTLSTLSEQHREHARLEDSLAILARRFDGGPPSDVDVTALIEVATALNHAYAAHLDLEDRELLPAARQLAPSVLEDIASEMQARRGR
jgi:hemerythrin-like domain-containing protein